ncbi:nucleotidyltransferase family protein [Psychrobacter sp. AOP7-B1-25]|uniref:nucleotidyltransferase family protein n=1 Tax=Psychrobacter sp. AOP7-B1-25 TaxID=3457644 RepID=UPI00402B9D85
MSKSTFTKTIEHTESAEQQSQNHAVIILASGLSQRLGQTKQLLVKSGEPLITFMTRLAIATHPKVIVVVIPDSYRLIASTIAGLASQHPTVQIVMNSRADTGMAHSLSLGIETVAAFESTSIDRMLIMGVDQVLLDKPHLTALLEGKQTVVASRYHNWQCLEKHQSRDDTVSDIIGLPLAINYKLLKQWKVELTGDKGLRHLIRELPVEQIGRVDNDQLSYDIDTPEQLAFARRQGWLDS